jgi:hypothetical protein
MAEQHSAAVQLGSTRRDAPLDPNAPFYKKIWHVWKKISRWIGNQISRIVTSIMFVVVLPFFAIGVRMFSDPLELKPSAPARWVPLPPQPAKPLDEARNGF